MSSARTVLTALPTGIVEVSSAGVVRFANAKAADLMGLAMPALVGRPMPGWVTPGGAQPGADRLRIPAAQGQVVEAQRLPGALATGDPAGFTLILTAGSATGDAKPSPQDTPPSAAIPGDATIRLRPADRYDGLAILDREGRFQYFNPSSERVLGLLPGELEGRHWRDLVSQDDLPAAEAAFQESFVKPGTPISLVLDMRHKDGSTREMDLTAINLLDVPEVRGLLVYARDATSRHHLEEQLRRAQLLETVGQAAAGLAHDLNNLVHVAAGFTAAGLETLRPEDTAAADLARAQAALDRAGALVSQLLGLGRAAPGRTAVLDVNAWAARLLRLVDRSLGGRIQLKFLPGSNVPLVSADSGKLDQVLLNLCINARDAMPAGGTLSVVTAATVAPAGRGGDGPAWASIAVSDTGAGIVPENLSRIFEAYFTTKAPGQGTGLGLSTARGIVEQHGGVLRVESQPGRGATFRILLPPAPAGSGLPLAAAAPGTTATAPAAPGTTVLVADDDEAVRALIGRILQRRGFRVVSAAGGHEALRRFAESPQPIAMALLDVMMPDLGGIETAQRLRERDPRLPVLLCTAHSAQSLDLSSLQGAATKVLTKPYSPAALLFHVNALSADRPPAAP